MKIYNISILFIFLIVNTGINSNYLRHRLFQKSMGTMDTLDSSNNLLKEILSENNNKNQDIKIMNLYNNEKALLERKSDNKSSQDNNKQVDVASLKNVIKELVLYLFEIMYR